MARNPPPRMAIDVARRCPTMAPRATPQGDCREKSEKKDIRRIEVRIVWMMKFAL